MNWGRTLAMITVAMVGVFGGYQMKVHAQQELPTACSVVVPSAWGEYKGISSKTGLVFEDKDGTLRIISEIPCSIDRNIVNTPHVLVEIHRK